VVIEMGRPWLVFLLALCCTGLPRAATAADGRCPMRQVGTDGVALATAPARWGEWQWLTLAGGLGVVALSATLDDNLYGQWSDGHDGLADVGNISAFAAPTAALLYYGVRGGRGDAAAANTAWAVGESALFTVVATGVVKSVVGRERPDRSGDNDGSFHPFTLDDDHQSFPSFHTGLAFSTAAVLQDSDMPGALKGVAYGLAGLTAWARLHDDDHWFSDTVGGALLGYAIGRWTARRRHVATFGGGTVAPTVSGSGVGLAWQRRF
jgi:hypothetical protein